MNPQLSRRVAKIMNTTVVQNLTPEAHRHFVMAVSHAESFEALDAEWQNLILRAESGHRNQKSMVLQFNPTHDVKTGKFAPKGGSRAGAFAPKGGSGMHALIAEVAADVRDGPVTDKDIDEFTKINGDPRNELTAMEALDEKAVDVGGVVWGKIVSEYSSREDQGKLTFVATTLWRAAVIGRGNASLDDYLQPPDGHSPIKDGPNPKGLKLVDQYMSMAHLLVAQAKGVSLKKLREQLTEKYKNIVDESLNTGGVFVRVRPSVVEKILDSGRVKSQFETDTTSFKSTTERRRDIEYQLYGYDKRSPNDKRPIYGYVSADPRGRLLATSRTRDTTEKDWVDGYGTVAIKLKKRVYDRTTSSMGDSIDVGGQHMANAPTKLLNPTWHSTYVPQYGLARNEVGKAKKWASEIVKNKQLISDNLDVKNADSIGVIRQVGRWNTKGYVEAQVHGGVSVGDIEKMVFLKKPTKAIRDRLTGLGIGWEAVE